jgi:hypothetical protein
VKKGLWLEDDKLEIPKGERLNASTQDCEIVDDFLKACKKELSPLLDYVAT